MTNESVIRDQAYQFFIEEAPELLQEIETGILSLKQERDTAKIHSIMRAAHSLKGGSASVGLEAIKTIAHRLETIFKALYSDTVTLDTELETQLLQAYDCLRFPLMEQLQQGQFDVAQALANAEPILAQLETQCEAAIAATADFIPGSEDLGFSMAQSIFEIDVAEGLERLATVIADPAGQPLAGELRAQAEVFQGFAELLSLSGFGAIATAAIQALERHPHRALEIAQLALTDFQAGRSEVLNQPNSQGGCPSAPLLALAGNVASEMPAEGALETAFTESAELLNQLEEDLDSNPVFADLGLFDLIATEDNATGVLSAPETEIEVSPAESTLDPAEAIARFEPPTAAVRSETAPAPDIDTEAAAPTPEDSVVSPEATAAGSSPVEESSATPSTVDFSGDTPIETAPPSPVSTPEPKNELTDTLALETTAPVADTAEDSPDTAAIATDTADLPSVQQPAAAAPSQPGPQRSAEPIVPNLTVRVEAERLNRMSNLLGELTISRNGLELQNTQLRTAIKDLLGRFSRFQDIAETLRVLSDQMLIAPERRQARQELAVQQEGTVTSPHRNGKGSVHILEQEEAFDSLEMDSYTQLYSQTQTLLEETVQLEEAVEDLSLFGYQSEQSLGRHRKMLSQMQDELMWARMIPLEQVLNRFPRVLRDLSSTYNKAVNLQLSGTDILVDKAVLSKLYDPLVQLLRNSFDHGIEAAELRQQQGKPAAGQITIEARYQGRQVIIEVRDDGQGLNYGRIRDRAVAQGLLTADAAATCSDERLSQLIFEPGFSTAARVSELSGRGVGLDIVRDQLQSLNGTLRVASTPGVGTVFTLTLPLTLTIINLLICFVGPTPLAIRSDSIEEILIPRPHQLHTVSAHQQLLTWREENIPIYRLSDLLQYNCFVPEMPPSRVLATVPTPTNWEAPVLILKRQGQPFALQVDRLVTEQEMVVKPLGTAIKPPIFTYGCTVLGDGSLVPVIDGPVFVDDMIRRGLGAAPEASETDALAAIAEQNMAADGGNADVQMLQATTILVVDDAVTLRRTLALSLERAGYRVLQARDGQEALEQLERSQSIELVICDVEMPNMNGFEFLTKRRETPEFAAIPTLMLTSRGNEKHRWLAMKLGAADYFTKPYLEQELLGAAAKYISERAAVSAGAAAP